MANEAVFAIDDNQVNLELLRAVLETHGYKFGCARSADEALAALPGFRPAVILMDLQLPGVDGLTLTRRLRKDPAFTDVPIIAVTSYAMKGDRQRAIDASKRRARSLFASRSRIPALGSVPRICRVCSSSSNSSTQG